MKTRATLAAAFALTALAAPAARAMIPPNETVDMSKMPHIVMTHRLAYRAAAVNVAVASNPSGASANAVQGIYAIH